MIDFAVRSRQPELMEDPSVAAREMGAALAQLATINRLLNGYGPSLSGIAALLPPGARAFTVLDVGAGGGDLARRMIDWAAARGMRARVLGIDPLVSIVDYARTASAGYGTLRFDVADLFALGGDETFDVVHAAQVLHHFDSDRAQLALVKMYQLARRGVVVNDLHRHPLAYYSIKLLTRCFSRNRLIRNDGPVSVLRGFRRRTLERLVREAGLPPPEIRWRWAFRWQMVIRR